MNIFTTTTDMAFGEPWSVWLICFYLIYKGMKMTKTRVIKVKHMLCIPFVLLLFSIHIMSDVLSCSVNPESAGPVICSSTPNILNWAIALVVGAMIGCMLLSRSDIRVDKVKPLVEMPGSYVPLAIVIVLAISNYFFYAKLLENPEVVWEPWYKLSMLSLFGGATGFFLGRAKHCMRAAKKKVKAVTLQR